MAEKNTKLADDLRTWKGDVPLWQVAHAIGFNLRSLEGILQGRPTKHERALRLIMETTKLDGSAVEMVNADKHTVRVFNDMARRVDENTKAIEALRDDVERIAAHVVI